MCRLLADRMRDIGLPDVKSVRDFTYWATKEFAEEETRYKDATETMTSLSKRLSDLEEQSRQIPKVKQIPLP